MEMFSKAKWKQNRARNIEAARATKACLTNPEGYYRLSPDDQRVKEAVGAWVKRARNCHAIAMERRPVIENFILINGNRGTVQHGAAYAS